MNFFHYTPGYLSLSRKNLSWHKNNFHSFPHISLLSTLALLKNWGIVFLPAAPRPAFSSNHTPQSVGRKLTTLRERSVRSREVESSSLFRSTIVVVNCTGSRRLFIGSCTFAAIWHDQKDAGIQIPASFLPVLMGVYLSARPDWGSSGARSGRSVRRPGIFRGRPGSETYPAAGPRGRRRRKACGRSRRARSSRNHGQAPPPDNNPP